MLTNDRTNLVVQDEITLSDEKVGKEIKWFWQTKSYEIINLPPTNARYVKLQCYGAEGSVYNSYAEIQFWKLGK